MEIKENIVDETWDRAIVRRFSKTCSANIMRYIIIIIIIIIII